MNFNEGQIYGFFPCDTFFALSTVPGDGRKETSLLQLLTFRVLTHLTMNK
jgi:hypothetical protein